MKSMFHCGRWSCPLWYECSILVSSAPLPIKLSANVPLLKQWMIVQVLGSLPLCERTDGIPSFQLWHGQPWSLYYLVSELVDRRFIHSFSFTSLSFSMCIFYKTLKMCLRRLEKYLSFFLVLGAVKIVKNSVLFPLIYPKFNFTKC